MDFLTAEEQPKQKPVNKRQRPEKLTDDMSNMDSYMGARETYKNDQSPHQYLGEDDLTGFQYVGTPKDPSQQFGAARSDVTTRNTAKAQQNVKTQKPILP